MVSGWGPLCNAGEKNPNNVELLKTIKNLVFPTGKKLILETKLKEPYFVKKMVEVHFCVKVKRKFVQTLFEKKKNFAAELWGRAIPKKDYPGNQETPKWHVKGEITGKKQKSN